MDDALNKNTGTSHRGAAEHVQVDTSVSTIEIGARCVVLAVSDHLPSH